MSTSSTADGAFLAGVGAAYVRVSDDEQDTARQYAAAHAFGKRHGVVIPKPNWFVDEGWARDTADRRPDFQRLLKLAGAGRVRWVVVDQLDRFGTKDPHQLVHYLYLLRESGCRLYDAADKEWTGADMATIITAVVEGEKSRGEQTSKSHRVLGGKVARARAGEWQGGPVRLGFDVACYSRATGKELWRVVSEGFQRRLKVYPDGRAERFDGKGCFPRFQEATEVLRIAPSRDRAKVAAAVGVFRRYAAEAVGFTTLAHWLNGLGFRTSYGGPFQQHHIEGMLEDPVYLGYYAYNRRHSGKFHRWTNGRTAPELNYGEKQTKNDKADWVMSGRLFKPLVDQKTWDAVQRKLGLRVKRTNAPRSAVKYLAGLVYCGNCGGRMVTASLDRGGRGRPEYCCGTYHKALREGRRSECKCLRNGVFQDVLESYVGRWLEETGRRLEMLVEGQEPDPATGQLEGQEAATWEAYKEGVVRLTAYLVEHCPDEYAAILRDDEERREAEEAAGGPAPPGTLARRFGRTLDDAVQAHANDPARTYHQTTGEESFVNACLAAYRAEFDPAAVDAEVRRLEAEHTKAMERWADLPTPRAKEKAAKELAALEARIADAERQREDAAGAVAAALQELHDLQDAIHSAKEAMRAEGGASALRRRAEALRAVVQRIECTFAATGMTGKGAGRKNSRLVKVTVYPVAGDSAEFSASAKGTLMYESAHSRM
jgi:DNA invertase Pin-like site-specific DNA recombinase